jgi:acetyl-CoA synthetase
MLSPIPGAVALKPGSCTKPVPGIIIDVIDENGDSVELGGNGYLVIKKPFPSQVRTIWNDKQRFVHSYYPSDIANGNIM